MMSFVCPGAIVDGSWKTRDLAWGPENTSAKNVTFSWKPAQATPQSARGSVLLVGRLLHWYQVRAAQWRREVASNQYACNRCKHRQGLPSVTGKACDNSYEENTAFDKDI